MRTFWKYFLITLLLVLGLVFVGVMYLFFVPGAQLFGIKYISLNDRENSEGYNSAEINRIVLNSRAYQTTVLPSDTENISLFVIANNTGFVNKDHSELKVDVTKSNGNLIFNVSEPYGATLIGDSRIILRMPKSKAFDLEISNLSGSVTINDEFLIDDFSYTTEYGGMSVDKATITGTLNLDIHDATVVFGENTKTSTNDLVLKANAGQVDLSKHSLDDVDILENNNCVLLIKSANNLDAHFETAGGRIEADTVGSLEVDSSDTNVYVNKLTNGGNVFLTQAGRVDIKEVSGALTVETVNGSIKVAKSVSPLNLTSKHGDIIVTDATMKVTATNSYGAIDVKFSESAPSNADNSEARKFVATNANGKITCEGADNVTIKATDNARVDLKMNNIVGSNSITGTNGAIQVVVKAESKFALTFKSQRNILVNLHQTKINGVTESTEPIYVNCDASTDVLDIKTKGTLTVLDTITVAL